jgi:hypothetical protein
MDSVLFLCKEETARHVVARLRFWVSHASVHLQVSMGNISTGEYPAFFFVPHETLQRVSCQESKPQGNQNSKAQYVSNQAVDNFCLHLMRTSFVFKVVFMAHVITARAGRAVYYLHRLRNSALPSRYSQGSSLHEEDLVALEKAVAEALVSCGLCSELDRGIV